MVDMVELMLFASLEKLVQVNRATFLFQFRSPPVRALEHHTADQSEGLIYERYNSYSLPFIYIPI